MRNSTMLGAALALGATVAIAAALPQPGHAAGSSRADTSAGAEGSQPGEEPRPPRALALLGAKEVQIGVSVRDLEGDQARTLSGARVEEVTEESPAAKAGVQAGDVIVEFDGERVRSARHLSRLVSETASGRTVSAAVLRNDTRVTLQVTPEAGALAWTDGMFPGTAMRIPAPGRMGERSFRSFRFDRPDGEPGEGAFELFVEPSTRGRLGIGIQELTPQLAEHFGTDGGVLISRVDADSPAAKAGLKAGDVITAVNDQAVASVAELRRELGRAGDGAQVSIGYTRDRKSGTATATLDKRERPRRPVHPA